MGAKWSALRQFGLLRRSARTSCPVRVLVVDDSHEFASLVCALLEMEQVVDVVGRAADGFEAVQAVAELSPEVVVMDVHMRHMSGLAATAFLSVYFPATKVILMSADNSAELRDECLDAGAAAFLPKAEFKDQFASTLYAVLGTQVASDKAVRD